jgi:hypothetical protein
LHPPILSQRFFFLHHPNLAAAGPACAVSDQRLPLVVRPGRTGRLAQALLAPIARRCPSEIF